MINMAVSEDQGGQVIGIETKAFNVLFQALGSTACAGESIMTSSPAQSTINTAASFEWEISGPPIMKMPLAISLSCFMMILLLYQGGDHRFVNPS